MTRAAQTKAEKQFIDAKVAKVREVVHNVSKNDIVLALHNFEMDVDRTIGAFVDGGIETALGSWEKCNTTTKKKKGAAGAGQENTSAATSTTTETPKVSSVNAPIATARSRKNGPTEGGAPPKAPAPPVQSFAKLSEDEKLDELERLMHAVDLKSADVLAALDNVSREKSAAISSITSALKHRERQLDAFIENTRREVQEKLAHQRSAFQRVQQKNSTAAAELSRFAANDAALEALLQQSFAIHVDKTIKSIEKLGAAFAPSSPADVSPVVANETPPSPPKAVQENGQSTIPKQNGKPAAPTASNGKPKNAAVSNAKLSNGTDIKHSVSQTSLVSSVGEDSGLGQISPVYQDKHATPVADSGLLQSDGLSADQLADLQAIFQQNLQAKGINADVLAGIIGDSESSGSAARRRNAPRKEAGGPAGGAKPKQQNGKSGKTVKAGP